MKRFRRAIELERTYPYWRTNLAMALHELGQTPEALQEAKRATELTPENAYSWRVLADIHLSIGRRLDAMECYQRAIAIGGHESDLVAARKQLDRLRELPSKDPEAPTHSAPGVSLNPSQADFTRLVIDTQRLLLVNPGDSPKIAVARSELAAAPHDWRKWLDLADGLCRADRNSEGLLAARRANQIAPNNGETWGKIAWALLCTGEHEEALPLAETSLRLTPDQAWLWRNRGHVMHRLGRTDEAIQDMRHAVSLDPLYALAWADLAFYLNQHRKFSEALEAAKRAVMLDSHGDFAWHPLLVEQFGEPGDISALKRAIRMSPESSPLWWELAIAFQQSGRIDDALASFTYQTKTVPSSSGPWAMRAHLLNNAGRHDEALPAAQTALEIDDTAGFHWGVVATAHQGLGDSKAAVDAFKQMYTRSVDPHRHAHARSELEEYCALFAADSPAITQARDETFRNRASWSAWLNFAEVFHVEGRTEDGLFAARRATRQAPHEPDALIGLSELLVAAGRIDAATAAAREAIRLDPGSECAMAALAVVQEASVRD